MVMCLFLYGSQLTFGAHVENGILKYKSATEYDYPPFSVTTSGEADGFSVDLLKAVAEEMGLEISFKIDAWQTIKTELKNGEIDVLPLVGQTEERETYFDFSVPYIVLRGNIFIRDDNTNIKSEQDLYGKAIIVMRGDNAEEYARSIGLSENLILTSTYVEAFQLLSEGKYDAVLAQGLVGEKIINDYNLSNIEQLYTYDNNGQTRLKVHLTGYEQKFCFAVKEGDKALLAKLNEGLAIVSENGVYDKLYKKWFPFLIDTTPSSKDILKYLLLSLIPILLTFVIISFYTIKRQVDIKTKELRKTSLKLSLERNKYYATIVAIGEGVVVVDGHGMIEVINPIALTMLNLTKEEAMGMDYREIIKFTSTLDENITIDPIEEVMKTQGSYVSEDQVLLLSSQHKDYFVEVKATTISNEKNEIVDAVLTFSDVSKLKNHINQIEFLNFHDSLTNLFNRRYFEEQLQKLDNMEHYPLTIMMADINGLKLVNDAFGHLAGDDMLKEAANVMKQVCRSKDVVCRWGGDEYVIIMPRTSALEAAVLTRKMKEVCKRGEYSFGLLSLSFGHDTKYKKDESIEAIFKNAEEFMYKEKVSETEGTHGETIRMILSTLFEKSPRDKEHCDRVSELGVALAEKLELHQSKIADIKTLGLLHDIGKIIVPQAILDKTPALTDEEYDEIKKHPLIGYRMLNTTNEFAHIAKGVLQHHERIDGKGYPEGISGDAISTEAKIIAIVDTYDAMTAYRTYKSVKMSKEEAAKQIYDNVGTQFDERIATIFIEEILNLSVDKL
jgi:diguanylate cyclase (GGDEF)-like protein